MKKHTLLLVSLVLYSLTTQAQSTVNIDIEEQRFLDNVSYLERDKYFVIHDKSFNDADINSFIEQYDVTQGRRFFGPFTFARQQTGVVGDYPSYTPGTDDSQIRAVSKFVATTQPNNVLRYNLDREAAADWAVEYWLDEVNDENRAEFWEPMNEPFIHSDDDEFTVDQPDQQLVRVRMAEWFATLGKRVKETPQLANMKMVGYSSAWPSMERFDFGHWEDRMKMFIDIAGEYMDAISVHTYDGVNIAGQDNRRSGSNSEAILDLIDTYTVEKFGTPKKIAITEYGIIEKGYPEGYNEPESAISIRGINSMLFNFMERQDNMAFTVPFITGKANFYYRDGVRTTPYVPALFRPLNQLPTDPYTPSNWVPSYKENFYKLWSGVKGNRTFIQSEDVDVQVQSFLDGNELYLAFNNLDNENKTVALNMLSGLTDITTVETRSLKVFNIEQPSYTITSATSLPSTISLDDGETVVLKVTYTSAPNFTKSIVRKKYYGTVTSTTVNPDRAPTFRINANVANTFEFADVDLGTGQEGVATLRLGVGRVNNEVSTNLPNEILVNGTPVTIPTDWKGYDQANRIGFFGVIEIPVDIALLDQGTNNVSVTFDETGGRISSLILSVEKREDNCSTSVFYEDADNDNLGDPDNSIVSCIQPQGFVANADDICPNDPLNDCFISIPGLVEAEDYESQNGIQTENTADTGGGSNIGFIEDGDYTEYKINADIAGVYTVNFRVASASQGGSITISSNGVNLETVTVSGTGGWQNWQTITTTITLPEDGVQDIKLEYNGGNGFLFNINWIDFTTSVLSVDGFDFAKISIYPIPVENTIFLDGLEKNHTILITDITGKILKSQEVLSGEKSAIDVSQLRKGFYLLIDKKTNSSVKFIKE